MGSGVLASGQQNPKPTFRGTTPSISSLGTLLSLVDESHWKAGRTHLCLGTRAKELQGQRLSSTVSVSSHWLSRKEKDILEEGALLYPQAFCKMGAGITTWLMFPHI